MQALTCQHDDLAQLSAEFEGYENPTEPLSIRITCGSCGSVLTCVVQDVPLLDWETP